MSKIEVKAIPSSFVAKNMKLYSDTGAGEAKLFVGSTRNTKEFNEFLSLSLATNTVLAKKTFFSIWTK